MVKSFSAIILAAGLLAAPGGSQVPSARQARCPRKPEPFTSCSTLTLLEKNDLVIGNTGWVDGSSIWTFDRSQPLQAVHLSSSAVLARDWKTGSPLKSSFA